LGARRRVSVLTGRSRNELDPEASNAGSAALTLVAYDRS
jgi:hypothetical protein